MTKEEFDELDAIREQMKRDYLRLLNKSRDYNLYSQDNFYFRQAAYLSLSYEHALSEYLEQRIDENPLLENEFSGIFPWLKEDIESD
jgi:hypothetical protein